MKILQLSLLAGLLLALSGCSALQRWYSEDENVVDSSVDDTASEQPLELQAEDKRLTPEPQQQLQQQPAQAPNKEAEQKVVKTKKAQPNKQQAKAIAKEPALKAEVAEKASGEAKVKPETTPAKKQPVVVTSAISAAMPTAKLQVNIQLTNRQGESFSAEGALVSLTPLTEAKVQATAKKHIIDTEDKTYMPKYLTVNVGDTLQFNNGDPIQHNVFSSTKNNTFDLGTYGFGKSRKHQVKNAGVIKVYCNIHPEMSLFILAADTEYKAVATADGSVNFSQLPAGRYLLSIWHLRGNIEKKIDILASNKKVEAISIDTSAFKPKPHLNKHGKAYKKQPPIFQDEFY